MEKDGLIFKSAFHVVLDNWTCSYGNRKGDSKIGPKECRLPHLKRIPTPEIMSGK